MVEAAKVISATEKRYIEELLEDGKRLDGRGLMDFREIKIETNVVPKAEGSADVFLGNTRIITGVKYDIGTPFPDTPDKGVCTFMSEFVPIAHPMFETGPPREDSIEHARVVDRGIRHSDCIDNYKLCVIPEKWVYIIFTDMYVMNHHGNLWDCGHISSMAALLSAKIPTAKVVDDDQIEWGGEYTPLPIESIPMTLTFAKIGGTIILDPDLAEEMVLDARITFTIDEDDMITSMQKGGTGTFSFEEIVECAKKAVPISRNLRDKLNLRQYAPEL